MKYLVPVGGVTNDAFGILATYHHRGVPSGIIAGLPWWPTAGFVFVSEATLYLAGYVLLRKTMLWEAIHATL